MTWARLLLGLSGVVMLGFGGFFGWLFVKTRRRSGWNDAVSRIYLPTRVTAASIIGASLIVAAVWKARDAGYVAAGAMLTSAVVYNVLARKLRRAERRASRTPQG